MEENKKRLSAKEWVESINKETGSEHSDYNCNYAIM